MSSNANGGIPEHNICDGIDHVKYLVLEKDPVDILKSRISKRTNSPLLHFLANCQTLGGTDHYSSTSEESVALFNACPASLSLNDVQ